MMLFSSNLDKWLNFNSLPLTIRSTTSLLGVWCLFLAFLTTFFYKVIVKMDCKRLMMNVLHLIEGWRRPPHPHSRSLRWLRCSRLAFHWPDCWPRPHWPSSPSRSSCTCPSPCGWRGPWRKRRRSRTGHTWSRFLSLVVHLRPAASPDYHHYYGHYCMFSSRGFTLPLSSLSLCSPWAVCLDLFVVQLLAGWPDRGWERARKEKSLERNNWRGLIKVTIRKSYLVGLPVSFSLQDVPSHLLYCFFWHLKRERDGMIGDVEHR